MKAITGEYKREKYASPLEVIYVISHFDILSTIDFYSHPHSLCIFFFSLRGGKSVSLLNGRCLSDTFTAVHHLKLFGKLFFFFV